MWHNFRPPYNYMKNSLFILLVAMLILSTTPKIFGQGEVISNVRVALKVGSSKELIKYLYKSTDIDIDGDNTSYSKAQAEVVLKGFFKDFPPTDFQIIHQGASKAGSPYVIGQYSYKTGSFRVWIRLKEEENNFLVHAMSFYKD